MIQNNIQTYWFGGKNSGKQYPDLSTEDWISKEISKKSKNKLKDSNVDIFNRNIDKGE